MYSTRRKSDYLIFVQFISNQNGRMIALQLLCVHFRYTNIPQKIFYACGEVLTSKSFPVLVCASGMNGHSLFLCDL